MIDPAIDLVQAFASHALALTVRVDLTRRSFDTKSNNNLAQPVGIGTSCLTGWHPTLRYRGRRLLFSVTYGQNSLAVVLPFPVVSPEAPKLFVATGNMEKNHSGNCLSAIKPLIIAGRFVGNQKKEEL